MTARGNVGAVLRRPNWLSTRSGYWFKTCGGIRLGDRVRMTVRGAGLTLPPEG